MDIGDAIENLGNNEKETKDRGGDNVVCFILKDGAFSPLLQSRTVVHWTCGTFTFFSSKNSFTKWNARLDWSLVKY